LIILDFWSVGCGPCIKKIPNLNLIHKKHKDIVTLISINSDVKLKLKKLQDFIKDKAINYPVLVDNNANLMKEFNLIGWPAYFLIDRNGFFFKEPTENRINLSLDEIEQYLNR
jgi:cytochrome c biogenesis protein CcmG/thiol:disulfide interchange protein DsbE